MIAEYLMRGWNIYKNSLHVFGNKWRYWHPPHLYYYYLKMTKPINMSERDTRTESLDQQGNRKNKKGISTTNNYTLRAALITSKK